jgi:hypothetical protein
MAAALSSCGTDSTYAYNGAYPYDYPYPNGDFFFGDDARRFHHRFDHHVTTATSTMVAIPGRPICSSLAVGDVGVAE